MSDSAKLPSQAAQPPLHPTRIASALEALAYAGEGGSGLKKDEEDTCRAALQVMQRIQNTFGFTPTVADVVQGTRELMEAMARLNRR